MRISFCAMALLPLALLGAGCKKGPQIVGKWTGQTGAMSIDFDFKPDNTFAMDTKIRQFTIQAKGDYKLDGEKLTMTSKDLSAPGLPAALIAQAKSNPNFGKPQTMAAKFISDDQLSLSGGMPRATGSASTASTMTLTRVKEGS